MTRQLYSVSSEQTDKSNFLSATLILSLAVLLLLPALLFSHFVPEWAPPIAVVGLAAIFLLRTFTSGRLVSRPPVEWLLLGLLLLLPLNLWISENKAITLPRIYAFIANLAVLLIIAAHRDTPWLSWSGWALLGAGLVLSGVLFMGTTHIGSKLPFIDQNIHSRKVAVLNYFFCCYYITFFNKLPGFPVK